MRKEHTLNLRIFTQDLKIRKFAISCCESYIQGHSTNHFAKMYFSTQTNKNKSHLRHFQVFFNVAGKILSVPFSQQTVHRKFPSQENQFFYISQQGKKFN